MDSDELSNFVAELESLSSLPDVFLMTHVGDLVVLNEGSTYYVKGDERSGSLTLERDTLGFVTHIGRAANRMFTVLVSGCELSFFPLAIKQ